MLHRPVKRMNTSLICGVCSFFRKFFIQGKKEKSFRRCRLKRNENAPAVVEPHNLQLFSILYSELGIWNQEREFLKISTKSEITHQEKERVCDNKDSRMLLEVNKSKQFVIVCAYGIHKLMFCSVKSRSSDERRPF